MNLTNLMNLLVSSGTWFSIFELMSTAAVVTNCGLVFFTGTFFPSLSLFEVRAATNLLF